jgi:DNA-binding CsgD family transcriptional regulator
MSPRIFGRDHELATIEATLREARQGLAGVVFEGEPGIGKTTIWRQGIALASARGHRVLLCRAAPAEARLSFAALTDLLAPVERTAFEALPDPQRRALDAALLRDAAPPRGPDPRAIGTGVVSLLASMARAGPPLLAIDDLQWLDLPSARAIEFALRRLESHGIAVLATARLGEPGNRGIAGLRLDGRIKRLHVGPLTLAVLYRVIDTELGHGVPRPLLVRIAQACRGNPFYALEIVRALDSDGGHASRELPIPHDLRELVAARLRKLPRRTRETLLEMSATAQPVVRGAARHDLVPAEEAGVVRVGADGRIEFTHPLYANAIYATATRDHRRQLHEALSKTANDVEERARHLTLAWADDQVDADVADRLDEGVKHALQRGAIDVAADLEEHAARRTPLSPPDVRWHRLLRAARYHLTAGDPGRAKALGDEALAAVSTPSFRAHALHLLAEIAVTDRTDTAVQLLEEALGYAGDGTHAAELEISLGITLGSRFDFVAADQHLVHAVELAERTGRTALQAEALALKESVSLMCGRGVDENTIKRALLLEDPDHEAPFQMRVSLSAAQLYQYIGRPDVAREMFISLRERLTARGEERDLPWVLTHLAETSLLLGHLEAAEQEATEAARVAALTGVELFRAFALIVRATSEAIRGNFSGAREDGNEAVALCTRVDWKIGLSQASYALSLLALTEGDPHAAVQLVSPVLAAVEAFGVYEWPIAMSLPDGIEALVACGELERGHRLAMALTAWGDKFDRPWAVATSHRCLALVKAASGDLDGAAAAGEQAIAAHECLPMPFELARTLLVHGQVQRRRGERRAARHLLQHALTIFQEIGSRPWADKTRAEIARIGVRRAPETLTEGERRAAVLAAQGLTNPEIAARLFMSRRTVEANLARAYRKLDIRSRAELSTALSKTGSA